MSPEFNFDPPRQPSEAAKESRQSEEEKGRIKEFQMEHNRDWDHHTRPMLEAFAHAKFMLKMAVRYADLPEPPQPMPNGYAALLYLFDLR